MTAKTDGPWKHVEGRGATRVVVCEHPVRGGVLTLRWWNPARRNWNWKSLGKGLERDRRGKPLDASVEWAEQEAKRKSVALGDGVVETAKAATRPFTIGETEATITEVETGPYPHKTPFRDELVRALRFAVQVWGAEMPWSAIDDQAWTKLMRRRLAGLMKRQKQGIRSVEITVSRINTAAEWLRDQKKIPRDAAILQKKWKKQLLDFWRGEQAKQQGIATEDVRDPTPHRPRHTLEDMRKILAAAPTVDPRFGLLLAFAAEYRLGQARLAKRSMVTADTFTIEGRGKKGGAIVDTTDGQRAAWEAAIAPGGYLEALERAWLEQGTDYYVFPAGKMLGRKSGTWRLSRGIDYTKPVSREWIITNFHHAEDAAKVKRIKGGAAYLLRRVNVDAINDLGISGLGKQASGGWASTKVPDSIYSESTNKAGRAEAKRMRATTRGETNG